MFTLAVTGCLAMAVLPSHAAPLTRELANTKVSAARDNPELEFAAWVAEHKKGYVVGDGEYERRFATWKQNVEIIADHNSKHESYWLGLNVHADMDNDEFTRTRLGFDYKTAKEYRKNVPSEPLSSTPSVDLPTSVDWRTHNAVSVVKNQQQCGSCWAFSTTGAVEGINAIYTGKLESLSEQELVDCDVGLDHGCHGGIMDHAFQWVIDNGGIDTESDYKYHAQDGNCSVSRENRHVVTIQSYGDVPEAQPKALLAAVARQPVSIAIQANQQDFQLYSGGVFSGECGTDLDHGVLIVGYGEDSGKDYWLVKNSWGPQWGEEGYIRIERNMTAGSPNKCGVTLLPSYPIKTEPNPPRPAPTPPSPPSPPPPSPMPVQCDTGIFCPPHFTCCCMMQDPLSGSCFSWACCPIENAVCCDDHIHCCPPQLPVCDVEYGRCGPGARGSNALFDENADLTPIEWMVKTPAFSIRGNSHQADDMIKQD